MASSGSIITGEKEGRSITLSWTLSSQNVEGNYSTIAWTLKGSGSGTSWVKSGGFKAVINGTTVYFTSTDDRIQLKKDQVIASGTLRIDHTADGTKSFSLSCEAGVYTYDISVSASGTHTLNPIPRASGVSMPSATMETAVAITISRASSSFTHTLTYAFGTATGTIVTKTTATSVSWTPPLSLATQIPNALTGTGKITCTTYNGNTKIGSKTCTLTLSVPASVKPTAGTLVAERVDGEVPASWWIYVQAKSKVKLTVSGAAGSYGSTISAYSITGGGYSSTASSFTTGFLNTSGTVTFTATVTDSRGRVSSGVTVSISVAAYAAPGFDSYLSQRALSTEAVNDDGTYVRGLVSFSFSSCTGKNSVSTKVEYRKSGESAWTNANVSFSSGTAVTFGGGAISTETSYEIRYTITDSFASISVVDVVSTAAVVMDFRSGGRGVAVGKVSETDDCFEVSEKWEVKVYGKLLKDYIKQFSAVVYPVGSIYMSVNPTNPAAYFGGTWVAWGSGRVPVGINTADGNFNTVEKTGGAETVTLAASQIPSHTHAKGILATANTGAHTHNLTLTKTTWSGASSSRVVVDSTDYTALTNKATSSAGAHTHTVSGSTAATGGGGAHTNLQPYIVCYMWKRTA